MVYFNSDKKRIKSLGIRKHLVYQRLKKISNFVPYYCNW